MKAILIFATASIRVAFAGCATVNPRAGFDRAARDVARAVGTDALYQPDDERENERRVAGRPFHTLLESAARSSDAASQPAEDER